MVYSKKVIMDKKWGVINKSGQYIIEPIFDVVGDPHGGITAIQYKGKWGYIDRNGYVIVEPQYDEVSWSFSEGLAYVKNGNTFFYIDSSGQKVIGPMQMSEYSDIGLFHEGLAFVRVGSRCGYINRNLQFVIDPTSEFNEAWPFHDGCAIVRSHGKWGCIDKTGRFILAPNYDWIEDEFHEGLMRVGIANKIGFVDHYGKTIIEPKYGRGCVDYFSEGLAAARVQEKCGFIDKTGKFAIEPIFKNAGRFCENMAPVQYGTKFGYINKTGNYVIEPQFDYAERFFGGYAYVKKGNKNGVIDKFGHILFEPKYVMDDWREFHDNMGIVWTRGNDDKFGYIDNTRQLVINPIFDEAYDFHEGLARVGVKVAIDTHAAFQKLPRRSQSPKAVRSTNSTNSTYHSQTPPLKKQSSGCYVATAVYGNYDCPEVWTLRRYRDNVLDNSWYGKLFIRTYYAISPTLVKWFGATKWFRNLFIAPLNKWVAKLNKRGFENTPYKDKY